MKEIIRQLEQYFRETLGITVTPHPWESKTRAWIRSSLSCEDYMSTNQQNKRKEF